MNWEIEKIIERRHNPQVVYVIDYKSIQQGIKYAAIDCAIIAGFFVVGYIGWLLWGLI